MLNFILEACERHKREQKVARLDVSKQVATLASRWQASIVNLEQA